MQIVNVCCSLFCNNFIDLFALINHSESVYLFNSKPKHNKQILKRNIYVNYLFNRKKKAIKAEQYKLNTNKQPKKKKKYATL